MHYPRSALFNAGVSVLWGQEKLMLAPTPHLSQEMMDQFTKDLLSAWLDLGLPLTAGAGLAAAA